MRELLCGFALSFEDLGDVEKSLESLMVGLSLVSPSALSSFPYAINAVRPCHLIESFADFCFQKQKKR